VTISFRFGLVIALLLAIIPESLAGASPVLSTKFNQTIFTTDHNQPITIPVLSSIGTNGSIFINGSPNVDESPFYKAEVTSKTGSQYIFTVTPVRPITNGTYELNLSTDASGSNQISLNYSINLDLDSENLYTVNGFSLECSGQNSCHVQPDITGDYPDEWVGQAKIEFRTRAKGASKWSSYPPIFDTFVNEPSELFLKLSAPTEITAKVSYRDQVFNLYTTVKPKPTLFLSAPGSAIVGFNFTATISGPKTYSGSCFVNGFSVAVKNGVGKIGLYGKRPGNLRLWMTCTANSNWEATSQGTDIYIRS
jgi:hypothetical protein